METHSANATNLEKFRNLRSSLTAKFVGVLFLTLLLMIPLGLVEDQVSSRAWYQDQVTEDIASAAASSQTVIGPVLAVHYRTKTPERSYYDSKSGTIATEAAKVNERVVYIPAKRLTIRGNAGVELRKRGIYQARLFHLDAEAEGMFEAPADMIKITDGSEFMDARAAILFSVSDLRGFASDPDVLVNGRTLHFRTPNDKRFEAVMSGSRLEINLGAWLPDQARNIAFSFPLKLTGTEALAIAPTAENNIVALTSDWKHPSFGGRFLPRKHEINAAGFTSEWEISQLSRNLDHALDNQRGEALTIRFIEPVNIYLQAERAVKYGSLFIVLTFAAFFIGEALRRRPMHIMQYALVGLSLSIFFLLLIALSEHLPFAWAYLAGAVACIGLIVIYLAGVFGSSRIAASFGGGLAALYGTLYAILQLEDTALLMGSLLLFAALAAIMLSTRHFDWYQLKQGKI
ncbi:MAG: cell envelope integrity protein CreD [Betaproteobacteria bacterium]|nr:cell envelope integrity protein CreD [Betaproteobacteria bacterium]